MLFDLYCQDGSPLGIIPPDIYGRGVGGAELAMMSWAETMVKRGHQVRIYNNPTTQGEYDGVVYLPQAAFDHTKHRDVFIIYRSPNPYVISARADVKLHWSCDQYTIGNYATDIFPFVDRIVCISPFHVEYHKQRYNADPEKIGHFDLGVRLWEYDGWQPSMRNGEEEEVELNTQRIPGRCIYCSVPSRGLDVLRVIWPMIKERRPDASLVITADFTLWGADSPGNHKHRLEWLNQDDVAFLGNIPRKQLIQEQQAAQVQAYPCTYDELFCISAAECQVAGAVPVTTPIGALRTTNQWGHILEGNPGSYAWQAHFADRVVEVMDMTDTERHRRQEQACDRFNWERICAQWERLIETGKFV